MATFFSAGHHDKDPGAVGVDGITEASRTKRFRNKVVAELRKLGVDTRIDADWQTLGQYLASINPTEKSVVCEAHFNASANAAATGIEVLIPDSYTKYEHWLATELCEAGARIMGIKNRGVKTESMSHRGSLGLMREGGMNVLLEMCFISNRDDIAAYDAHEDELAVAYAAILKKYDDLL